MKCNSMHDDIKKKILKIGKVVIHPPGLAERGGEAGHPSVPPLFKQHILGKWEKL